MRCRIRLLAATAFLVAFVADAGFEIEASMFDENFDFSFEAQDGECSRVAFSIDVPFTEKVGCCHKLDMVLRKAFERRFDIVPWDQEMRLWRDRQRCMQLRGNLFAACNPPASVKSTTFKSTCVREPGSYWGPSPKMLSGSEMANLRKRCRDKRYLLWTRSLSDYYAGHSHKQWSMECSMAEAVRLNRTLLLDSFLGIDAIHITPNRKGQRLGAEMPFGAWRSEWHIRQVPAITWQEFAQDECGMEGVLTGEDIVNVRANTPFAEMEALGAAPLLIREFVNCVGDESEGGEPNLCHYSGFDVCESAGVGRLEEPWEYSENAQWLQNLADKMLRDMTTAAAAAANTGGGGEVVCVHVRRGDKAAKPRRWPNVGRDTTAAGLLQTLQRHVAPGSAVYVATNEPDPNAFFAPLRQAYLLYSYQNFTGDADVGLLPSTIGLLDYSVLRHCEKLIPTFSDEDPVGFPMGVSLTADTKQGLRGSDPGAPHRRGRHAGLAHAEKSFRRIRDDGEANES